MHSFRYISNDTDFRAWRASLPEDSTAVAVDIEAEFNLHIYGEHFCLLQVFDGKEAAAIDPQGVSIELIKDFFEDRSLEKITYDSASDRVLLYKNHSILMNNLIDLRPAVDLLEFNKQGLGAVLETVLGITPERGKKRFQQYNWTRRPIHPEALQYAIDDVRHLYCLRRELFLQLEKKGLMEQYSEENSRLQDGVPVTDRKPGMLRSGRFKKLKPHQQNLLEKLYREREQVASQVNLPPNTVFPNNGLFALVCGQYDVLNAQPSRNMPRTAYEQLINRLRQMLS
ncbi:ribonuclease D [Spirochaeta dissipatitropha]